MLFREASVHIYNHEVILQKGWNLTPITPLGSIAKKLFLSLAGFGR